MSSYGPPGVNAPHPSLPKRPPPSTVATSASSYSSTVSAPPSAVTSASYGPSPGSYPGAAAAQPHQPHPRLAFSRTYAPAATAGGYNSSSSNAYQQQQRQQPMPSYGPQVGAASYGPQYGPYVTSTAAPQIHNPFPAPGEQQYEEDPQMAAQIASWQSAYMPKENSYDGSGGVNNSSSYNASAGQSSSYPTSYGAESAAASSSAAGGSGGGGGGNGDGDGQARTKTVYRTGGGKTWQDDKLLEWDPSHLRLFVGNLAGEVTDETLLKAFSRWKSVQKALVKRDKWTHKSRGYGFVSFSDADDFFQAAKEMNGKYIGSHPVVVRKSTTEIKVSTAKDDKKNKKNNNNKNKNNDKNKKKHNPGSGGEAFGKRDAYEPGQGPVSAGVHKHGQKTKGGLKLLG